MARIVPLAQVAPDAIEMLLDAAFGTDRRARTAYRLREGVPWIAEFSFAAIDRDVLVGSVQCWPLTLESDGARTPLTLVGPVAVTPDQQRGGIGRALMTRCLEATAKSGHDALAMIGDPEYYGRFFGFTAEATARWDLPGPVKRRRLLARIDRAGGVPAAGVLGPDPGFASEPATA